MAQSDFKNKKILILGAASGYGHSLAKSLAQAGAQLFLLDHNSAVNTLRKSLAQKTSCAAAVVDFRAIDALLKQLDVWFSKKKIDGLVYFTRGRQRYSFADLDGSSWEEDFRLSVFAAMEVVHYLWKRQRFEREASLVFLSSVCAQFSGSESLSYNMSKSALESMCRYLAVELGGKQIRVNSLQLGFIVKDEHKGKFYSAQNAAYRRWAQGVHPLGRVGHNEDVVGPLLFLLSSASAFISGQTICVDGGLSIQEQSHLVKRFMETTAREKRHAS